MRWPGLRHIWSLVSLESSVDELDFSGVKIGFPLAHLRESIGVEEKGGEGKDEGRSKYTVADIFRLYGTEYRTKHAISPNTRE